MKTIIILLLLAKCSHFNNGIKEGATEQHRLNTHNEFTIPAALSIRHKSRAVGTATVIISLKQWRYITHIYNKQIKLFYKRIRVPCVELCCVIDNTFEVQYIYKGK